MTPWPKTPAADRERTPSRAVTPYPHAQARDIKPWHQQRKAAEQRAGEDPAVLPGLRRQGVEGPSTKQNPQKLRESLAGAVLILLAGQFRGKRVVLLKALESGLLLVTGPFAVNGVPIKRMRRMSSRRRRRSTCRACRSRQTERPTWREKANIDEKDDNFFGADKPAPPVETSDERKKDQKAIDDKLLKVIEKTPMLKAYLGALFTLTKGAKPHEMGGFLSLWAGP